MNIKIFWLHLKNQKRKKMSKPVITLTSGSNMSTSHNSSSKSGNTIRDASFSSYLNGTEETFVLELLATSTRGLNHCISAPQDHIYLGRNRATEDREIDVFDAKKYFNEGVNHGSGAANKEFSNQQCKKDDRLEIFAIKEQPPVSTLSTRSESSSNSQSSLLQTVLGNQQAKKSNKKSFLASIGCNCSCSDKNSVEIDGLKGENCSIKSNSLVDGKPKQAHKANKDHSVMKSRPEYNCLNFHEPGLRVNSDGHLSFPVFNPKTENQAAKLQLPEEEDATRRKSLEVFGSPILETGKNCLSLEKKLTMLTWDAIAPGAGEELRIPSISSDLNNDSDSDASSDLFEIESLSKGNPFLSRQASDGMSDSIIPTNCYAPSEVSIEWSVVTASAADFSIFSDFEEFRSASNNNTMPYSQKMVLNSSHGLLKEMPKRRSGILSGCMSQKAVRVAGDAHTANEKKICSTGKLHNSETFSQVTRFHKESKIVGLDSRKGQQSFDARVLSQSHRGSSAHLLIT